jgi:hypothetical protein
MKIINSILEALNEYLTPDNTNNQHGLIFIPIPERSELERKMNDTGRR